MTTSHVQPAATQDTTTVEYTALPVDGFLAALARRADHRTAQAVLVDIIPPCVAPERVRTRHSAGAHHLITSGGGR
jgi:hypothetical protein